jgi:hypothetical protein
MNKLIPIVLPFTWKKDVRPNVCEEYSAKVLDRTYSVFRFFEEKDSTWGQWQAELSFNDGSSSQLINIGFVPTLESAKAGCLDHWKNDLEYYQKIINDYTDFLVDVTKQN